MANTINAILPSIYAALDMVSREMVGMIPAVQRNATLERAAVGQTVTIPVVPPATGGNITPASVPPDDGDAIIGTQNVVINKSKYSPVRWNGEEQLALGPGGMYNTILSNQFAQAMRWLVNQIEVDGCDAGATGASRAYGTAGQPPFGVAGDLTDFAGINKILDENGAPQFDRRLIIGSAARYNLEGKQSVLFKANEAATDAFLRRRMLTEVMGFGIGYSAGIHFHTKGNGTGYATGAAAQPIGTQLSAVVGGTPGASPAGILDGDIVTYAGDTNKYNVRTGLPGAAGNIELGAPGLRAAAAPGTLLTIGPSFTANLGFTPDALVLAARAPALPTGGDSADDRTFITDPVSGLSFEVSLYREYRRIRYEVAMAWGWGVVKEEHIAILLG
jgi:hypothetical protein